MGRLGRTKSKPRTRGVIRILAALALLGGLAAPSGAYQRPGRFERVSVASGGRQSEGETFDSFGGRQCDDNGFSISRNGRYVAFTTNAADIVSGDSPGTCDIFVHDRVNRHTVLASVGSSGTTFLGGLGTLLTPAYCSPERRSLNPSLSASGRYVAFETCLPLDSDDTNLTYDIYVRDLQRGTTERISQQLDDDITERLNGNGPGGGGLPSISANGRYVAFASGGKHMVEDQRTDRGGVFVRDRKKDKTELVSVASDGTQANGVTSNPSISGNGRYVVFYSTATNLIDPTAPANPLRTRSVYIHDRITRETERISVKLGTTPEDNITHDGSDVVRNGGRAVSRNGRYVTFYGGITTGSFVPNDSNQTAGGADVFVLDRSTGRYERVSISSDGSVEFNGQSGQPSITADGRFVIFESLASNFDGRIFIYDRKFGVLEAMDLTPGGEKPASSSFFVSSVDNAGRYAVFASTSDEFVREDTNDNWDIFVRDRGPDLGIGGLVSSGSLSVSDNSSFSRQGCLSTLDDVHDLDEILTKQGANLYGASLAYRPQYEDLFAAIELEHMPQVTPGVSPIFYGLRFNTSGKSYEVRATSLLGGTLGLFDCTGSRPACTKVADLRGGYGTTGMRVVFSLPLKEVGLEAGGKLRGVTAISALGSYLTGATKVLDAVRIK